MVSEPVAMTPEMITDADGGYAEVRRRGGVCPVVLPDLDAPTWLVTGHDDVAALLGDRRLVRDPTVLAGPEEPSVADQMIEAYGLPGEYRPYLDSLVLHDGDEHARRRRGVSRTFTARRVAALRPLVEALADRLVDAAAGRGVFDLLDDVLNPLTGRVICHLVGFDEDDHFRLCDAIGRYHSGHDAEVVSGLRTIVETTLELVGRRRREPRDDLVSELVDRRRSADAGADDTVGTDIVSTVFLLVNTGRTPPSLFLANAVLALLDAPEQLLALRREPDRLPAAITELLRRAAPVTIGAPHYVTEDLVIGGVPIRRGEVVTPALHAANHDASRFGDPFVLDLARPAEQHVSFGRGPHYCLGAALAKLEADVVLRRLLFRDRAPRLAVPREDLEFSHFPGEGLHLLGLPLRL